MGLTPEQQRVIETRDKNILVSAAAGSGKTSVLVGRINALLMEGRDIDSLLIVTFTKAATREMRERIALSISKTLEEIGPEHPQYTHMQRQATLVHHAQITTIDSFCMYVVRNHFHEIGLDPSFRIGDPGELKLMSQDVLEEVLEELFTEKPDGFLELVDSVCPGKSEKELEQLITDLAREVSSHPFPAKWLHDHKKDYEPTELNIHQIMVLLEQLIKEKINGLFVLINAAENLCNMLDGPEAYLPKVEEYESFCIRVANAKTAEECITILAGFDAGRLSSAKKKDEDPNLRASAKKIIDTIKNRIREMVGAYAWSKEDIEQEFATCDLINRALCDATGLYMERFLQRKVEKNVLDFSDIAHFALRILCEAKDGKIIPTAAALEFRKQFSEIMIDEYQDSNDIQEQLLSIISGEEDGIYNRFMVGDMKQSIYRFRQAKPDLFLEKLSAYGRDGENCVRIDLSKNFRSRNNVLASVNLFFSQLMSANLGGIEYDNAASLHYGNKTDYQVNEDHSTEILIGSCYDRYFSHDKLAVEMKMIAGKIKELFKKEMTVFDKEKGTMRPLSYSDIVILFRSPNRNAEKIRSLLQENDIPVYIPSKNGYYDTMEVRLVLDVLTVLDNPLQDIALYHVMHSVFGHFSDEELAKVVAEGEKDGYLWEKVNSYGENGASEMLSQKCADFSAWINQLRGWCQIYGIHEILEKLYATGHFLQYIAALPFGAQRRANLDMLFEKAVSFEQTSYKGVYHFVRYIRNIRKSEVQEGEAYAPENQEGVVQVMSIHSSKGLEFPVVFVAGMGAELKRRNIAAACIIDGSLGIGFPNVDLEKRMRMPGIRKGLMREKDHKEELAEELRILYVALTRAKEKLIITAVTPQVDKVLENLLGYRNYEEREIDLEDRLNAKSFLELILYTLVRTSHIKNLLSQVEQAWEYQEKTIPLLEMYYAGDEELSEKEEICFSLSMEEDLFSEAQQVEDAAEKLKEGLTCSSIAVTKEIDEALTRTLEERFSYQYPYTYLQKLYAKTTVSELKMAAIAQLETQRGSVEELEEQESGHLFGEKQEAGYLPTFLRGEEKIKGTDRGSAMHRILECMDFGEKHTEESLKTFVLSLVQSGKLSETYAKAANYKKLLTFTKSDLFARMAKADREGLLFREQPFVLGIAANRMDPSYPAEETVMIQGIIDAFFVEDGKVVLLDYKTDVIKNEAELVERYRLQLTYYKEAIEKITGYPVKEMILYSFCLLKEVVL